MFKTFRRIARDEQGAALVEYGLLVGLIAVVCIAGVTALGLQIQSVFCTITNDLQPITGVAAGAGC
jgi:pilus assembly protein Flp/PilA